MYYIITTNVF